MPSLGLLDTRSPIGRVLASLTRKVKMLAALLVMLVVQQHYSMLRLQGVTHAQYRVASSLDLGKKQTRSPTLGCMRRRFNDLRGRCHCPPLPGKKEGSRRHGCCLYYTQNSQQINTTNGHACRTRLVVGRILTTATLSPPGSPTKRTSLLFFFFYNISG